MITELLESLKADGISIQANGQVIELFPPEKVTEDLIQRLRASKLEIIAELKRMERRQKVLDILAKNPDKQRAYITDDTDKRVVILAIGIRNVATFEMEIPRAEYDPFVLLNLIDKQAVH